MRRELRSLIDTLEALHRDMLDLVKENLPMLAQIQPTCPTSELVPGYWPVYVVYFQGFKRLLLTLAMKVGNLPAN